MGTAVLVITLTFAPYAFACGSTYSTGQHTCCGVIMTIGLCGGIGNACQFGANWRDCGSTGCQVNSADYACFNQNAKREVTLLREPIPQFQKTSVLACNPQQTTAFNEWLEGRLHNQNR